MVKDKERRWKTLIQKDITHPNVQCSIIYNSQDAETNQTSIDREMGKETWYIHTMEYWQVKNGRLPFAMMWMDLDDIMLSGVSQTEIDKYYILSLTHEI